jgi:hypothetical protein
MRDAEDPVVVDVVGIVDVAPRDGDTNAVMNGEPL